jgi:hypothetical protein
VVDNVSWIRGRHSFKAGIDAQWVGDDRVKGERFEYVFPTIDAYLAASAGSAPLGYTTFRQDFGDLTASYSSGFYGFFVQDDWQVTPNLKVLYGLRYDLFDVPSGAVVRRQSVLAGFHHRQEQLGTARRSIVVARPQRPLGAARLDRPDVRAAAARLLRQRHPQQRRPAQLHRAAGRHERRGSAFPASLANAPAGFVLPRQSINAVDPAFRTQSAWLTNVQFERAIRTDMSVAVGYVNSTGRNLPVLMDINLIPTGVVLPDGRPVFSTAGQRGDPLRSAVRPRQHVQVDWRGEVQRVHGDVHQADDAGLAGAGHLHAGQGGGRRPAHRHLRRRQRRRPRLRSGRSRS